MVFPIAGGTQDTGYEISNSLRFNDDDSSILQRTASGGNRRTFTWSSWIKRGNLFSSASKQLFTAGDGTTQESIMFTNDSFRYIVYNGSSNITQVRTNALLRDPSAWYHLVVKVDYTQSTASNRVKLYINGTEQTSLAESTYANQNTDTYYNQSGNTVRINNDPRSGVSEFFDGYYADMHFLDGVAYDSTYFGETNDNGVWIPKKYTGGNYGTNGFYLQFKETGTSANSSGMGADTSGNDNHFTPTNLASTDVTADTPTNNFATLNSLYNFYVQPTLSEGNCKVSHSSAWAGAKANMAVSKGKWYWEIKLSGSSMGDHHHGVQEINVDENAQNPQNLTGTTVFFNDDGGEIKVDSTATTSDYGTLGANDILGVALNMDGGSYGQITFYDNGSAIVSNANLSSSSDYVAPFGSIGNSTAEYNFGNPSFSISSGNADANGYGNFEYSVPSGYYALCTKNLAEYG